MHSPDREMQRTPSCMQAIPHGRRCQCLNVERDYCHPGCGNIVSMHETIKPLSTRGANFSSPKDACSEELWRPFGASESRPKSGPFTSMMTARGYQEFPRELRQAWWGGWSLAGMERVTSKSLEVQADFCLGTFSVGVYDAEPIGKCTTLSPHRRAAQG